MSMLTISASRATTVGMGQVCVARAPDTLHSVLGSCMGVALYHPRLRIGALAHVVLPQSSGRPGTPGKFADTAVPYMLELLREEGALGGGLTAKLAGGASMFGSGGPMQVGTSNLEAVLQALAKAQIAVVGQHVGGIKGRRIRFDCETGELQVEIAGCSVAVL